MRHVLLKVLVQQNLAASNSLFMGIVILASRVLPRLAKSRRHAFPPEAAKIGVRNLNLDISGLLGAVFGRFRRLLGSLPRIASACLRSSATWCASLGTQIPLRFVVLLVRPILSSQCSRPSIRPDNAANITNNLACCRLFFISW